MHPIPLIQWIYFSTNNLLGLTYGFRQKYLILNFTFWWQITLTIKIAIVTLLCIISRKLHFKKNLLMIFEIMINFWRSLGCHSEYNPNLLWISMIRFNRTVRNSAVEVNNLFAISLSMCRISRWRIMNIDLNYSLESSRKYTQQEVKERKSHTFL